MRRGPVPLDEFSQVQKKGLILCNDRYLAWVDMIYCSFDHIHSVKNHHDGVCILVEHGKNNMTAGMCAIVGRRHAWNATQDKKSVFSRVAFDANSFAF